MYAPNRKALTLLPSMLSAGLLAWQLLPAKTHHVLFNPRPYLAGGETLIHGLPPSPLLSVYMPLSCLSAAAVFNHHILSPYWNDAAPKLARMALVLSLGGLLQPFAGLAPMLAVLLLTAAPPGHALFNFPESYYSLLLLLAAGLLVWRAQKPTLGRSVLLSLGIGATLLFRSPLAFFPPLLALYETVLPGRLARPARRRQHLILCTVPFLFLLPWVQFNRMVQHQWIAFEHGPDTGNIIGAAVGLTDDGGRELTPNLIDPSVNIAKASEIYGGALRHVLRDPVRYLVGYVKRLALTIALAPFLLLCCALSVAAYWDREDFRQLGLLLSYFILIHCAITIQDRYFEPLWPLAAVGAASLFVRPLAGSKRMTGSIGYGASVKMLLCALALVLASCLATQALVFRYVNFFLPARRQMTAALDEAIAAFPNDAWLLSARGQRRLQGGDLSGAAGDLSKASALAPEDSEVALRLAWARMLLGDPASLLAWQTPKDHAGDMLDLNGHIFKAQGLLKSGRIPEAGAELRLAADSALASALPQGYDPAVMGPFGFELVYSGLLKQVLELLRGRPAAERLALIDELVKIIPACGDCLRAQAQARYQTGAYGPAASSLSAAQASGSGTPGTLARDELLRAALAIGNGRKDEARQALSAARQAGADEPDVLIAAARLDNRLREIEALRKAAALEPRNSEVALRLARTRKPLDNPSRLLAWQSREGQSGDSLDIAGHILKAHGLLRSGRILEADGELRSGLDSALASAVPEGFDPAVIGPSGFEPVYSGFLKQALEPLRNRPAAERLALLDEFVKIMPACGDCLRAQAQARYDTGAYGPAAASLAQAQALGSATPGTRARDELLRAALAINAGRKNEARQALLAARQAGADAPDALIAVARLYNRLGEFGPALEILGGLPGPLKQDPSVLLERAAAERAAGRGEAAALSLDAAAALTDDPAALRKISFLYQEAGRYPEALALFDRLAGPGRGDAGLLKDRGICEFRAGRPQEAISSLRKAVALDPRQLDASLTLGAVYASRGQYGEAVKAYDSALSVPAPVDANMRALIVKDRRDCLGRLRRPGL